MSKLFSGITTPQALQEPHSIFVYGLVALDEAEKDLITEQSGEMYFESCSVTFYDATDVELGGCTFKIYVDYTDQTTPSISITPDDLRDKYNIATIGGFFISSQSAGSIMIQAVNPDKVNFLKITGTRINATDKCYRFIKYRK